MDKNKPCFERRIGNIRLAIWENVVEDSKTVWHNVSITRRFKSDDGWKEAATFSGLGDLAQVAEAVGLAQDWIRRRQEEPVQQPEALE